MRKPVKVKCPYCKSEDWIILSEGTQVLTCDIDDSNGCDKDFVVKVKFQPEYQVFKLVEVRFS